MSDSVSREVFERFEGNINDKIDRILDGQATFMEQQARLNARFNEHMIRDECADNERDTITSNIVERLDRHREKIKANKEKLAEHAQVVESVKVVNSKLSKLSMAFFLAFFSIAGATAYKEITGEKTNKEADK